MNPLLALLFLAAASHRPGRLEDLLYQYDPIMYPLLLPQLYQLTPRQRDVLERRLQHAIATRTAIAGPPWWSESEGHT